MKSKIIALIIALATTGIAEKAFAYDFHLSSGETIKYSQDFTTPLRTSVDWGIFSYSLANPINVNDGDIFLYWSSQYPTNPHRENDKYYVGLQYNNNKPVCWRTSDNSVIPKNEVSCPLGYQEVDEDALVRMNIRPIHTGNVGNTYDLLYQDPGFMINHPIETKLSPPFANNKTPQKYRLKIWRYSDTQIAATSYFWDDTLWKEMTVKTTNPSQPTLPILMDYTDELATFEAINIQFRRQGSSINAIALTQELNTNFLRLSATTVPEPGVMLGLFGVGFLGTTLKKRQKLDQK